MRIKRNGAGIRPVDIVTDPFPGFPTDLQAQFMVAARLLGKQAGAASFGVPKLPLDTVALRARLRIVECYYDLPGHHHIAVPDEDPSDNPALQMLNGLAAGLRFDNTRCDRSALQRRQDRPDSQSDDEDQDQQVPRPDNSSESRHRRRGGGSALFLFDHRQIGRLLPGCRCRSLSQLPTRPCRI